MPKVKKTEIISIQIYQKVITRTCITEKYAYVHNRAKIVKFTILINVNFTITTKATVFIKMANLFSRYCTRMSVRQRGVGAVSKTASALTASPK